MVFSDFNDEVLRQRIKEGVYLCYSCYITIMCSYISFVFDIPTVKAKAVITADIRVVGGEQKNLKEKIVRTLSKRDTSVEFVLIAKRSDTPLPSQEEVNYCCACITLHNCFWLNFAGC